MVNKANDIKLIQLASYVRPEVKEYYGRKWVLNGDKNSYPQYVIDRRIGSPTNGSIIEVFCELLYGKGLAKKGSDEVYKELAEIFPKREQRKCLDDFETFGYYFMQILRGKTINDNDPKKIAKIMHLPVSKMARDKMDSKGNINGAYYCEDWNNTNKYKPEFIKEFTDKLTDARMVKSVVPYQQGQDYYALPGYVQGLQYAEMEEEISNYCINHIKNGLSFGYIINFNNGGNLTPEQKDDVERMIRNKLTGSNNAGKFILSFNDSKEVEVTVVPLEVSDAHNQWEFLTKEARQQIITAHGAYPNLFGINSGNGFANNADELDVQSKLVQDYQINPRQSFFIDELATLLEFNGLETDLEFIPLRDTYKSTEEKEETVVVDEAVDKEDVKLAGFDPNQKRSKDGRWGNDLTTTNLEDKPCFKEWFSGSKIVDENGNPKIVYHATDFSFEEFKKPVENLMAMRSEVGFWFGSDKANISRFGENILSLYLSISNPRRITERQLDELAVSYPKDEVIRRLKLGGYDGLIIEEIKASRVLDIEFQAEQYVAFSPNQIKSVDAKSFCHESNINLSEDFNVDNLIQLGEEITDEWEVVDDRRCDEITLSEEQLNTVIELAQTPKTSNKKSEQDTSLFKIRYKYAGAKDGERDFCNKVIQANKVYRAEDLDANYNYNEDFAPKGKNSYNIFKFKGGVNCQHFWQRVIYLKKGNDKISVNKAKKMILALEPSERKDAKWETNDKRVAKPAEPQNNWWSLKPNYRNSGVLNITKLKNEILKLAGFDPNQSRSEKGNPDGGQWNGDGVDYLNIKDRGFGTKGNKVKRWAENILEKFAGKQYDVRRNSTLKNVNDAIVDLKQEIENLRGFDFLLEQEKDKLKTLEFVLKDLEQLKKSKK